MSNRILPLAQELNLDGIETNDTVYIDLSGAFIVSEVRAQALLFYPLTRV